MAVRLSEPGTITDCENFDKRLLTARGSVESPCSAATFRAATTRERNCINEALGVLIEIQRTKSRFSRFNQLGMSIRAHSPVLNPTTCLYASSEL